jgi:hypothetical protein
MRIAFVCLAAIAAASCATLSEDQCVAGAWGSIGFEDGAAGAPPERVGQHAEACARYGIAPDLALYQSGYASGLVTYCTRSTGFASGVRGAQYHGVCAGEAEAVFLTAYSDGREIYDVRQELARAQSRIGSLAADLDIADEDRDEARNRLDDDDVTSDERLALLERIEELSEDIGRYQQELADARRTAYDIEEDVRDVESRMRYIYPEWNGQ